METFQCILSRRSIRQYRGGKIPNEFIMQILKAGTYAPSARNYQPWHFIVIDKREILDKIPEVHPYAEMVISASLAILVCGDLNIEKSRDYNAINCAAATQNILLASHNIGLGAVWLGVYPRAERMRGLSRLMHLPDHIIPISLISIGYPAEEKIAEDRFRQERIHFNGWKLG